jgi:hypothetical protein
MASPWLCTYLAHLGLSWCVLHALYHCAPPAAFVPELARLCNAWIDEHCAPARFECLGTGDRERYSRSGNMMEHNWAVQLGYALQRQREAYFFLRRLDRGEVDKHAVLAIRTDGSCWADNQRIACFSAWKARLDALLTNR